MKRSRSTNFSFTLLAVSLFPLGLLASANVAKGAEPVDYDTDIRPLLSNSCYSCHGPDAAERQAGLRLDLRAEALARLESDEVAIVPGKPAESALLARITATDPDDRMPPVDSGRPALTAAQIELVKRWIAEGAEFQQHWSFRPPVRPELPKLKQEDPQLSPIDRFLRARLDKAGLSSAAEASKERLIRRVTYDLTGLPPTIEEIDAFLADDSPAAYERLVDRLLASNRYGEHMARYWLDAARYGDTHGLHLDNERSLWPYRTWVIESFNRNQPFDQFTVEQLAGDLLPNPTLEQRIATGFNRCNVTTSEGGSINEEYRVRYAVDRVETTSTVWLGMTLGCAVCHDHKFDPFSQREFYSLFDYFANTADAPMDGNALLPPPVMRVPSPESDAKLAALKKDRDQLTEEIKQLVAGIEYKEPATAAADAPAGPQDYVWIDDKLPPGSKAQGNSPWKFVSAKEHPVHSGKKSSTRTAKGLSQHFFTDASPGLVIGKGDKLFAYVYIDLLDPPKQIMLQFNDGDWEQRAYWGEDVIPWGTANTPSRRHQGPLPEAGKWVRLEVDCQQVGLSPGSSLNGWAFTQHDGTVYWDTAGLLTSTPQDGQEVKSLLAWSAAHAADDKLPAPIRAILKVAADKRDEKQQAALTAYFVEHVWSESRDKLKPSHQQLADLDKQIDDIEKSLPSTMVMAQKVGGLTPTYVLIRGEYDKPDKEQQVHAGVPASLHPLPKDAPPNRLGLAQWIVDPANPLTARVTVNRFWQQLFGTGLVKTSEDFGAQGELPSHPQLLDWLAVEFVETGWDVKRLMKTLVMSRAYRQSSATRPELIAKDPANRLLARGPRFRLDAEMIRDTALAVSGLLVEEMGGKSVRPYQPLGLWKAVGYTNSNTANFKQDHGDALYRRSMYTFWKRTSPPPTMSTFDAPSREACTVRRARTNTPLQALALMNDVQFVEAARNLAARLMKLPAKSPAERATYAFRLTTSRQPSKEELAVLVKLYERYVAEYRADETAAKELLSVGESPAAEGLDPAEQAAWTILGNLLLNLDETINKG